MNIRPKTIRRLLILLAAVAVVSGTVVVWVLLSVRRQHAQVLALRNQAIAAYDARDYPRAVTLFDQYFARTHSKATDATALYDFGKSRSLVPMDGNRQNYDAAALLRQYLDIEPADPHDARHLLLKLYVQTHYNIYARDLANELLRRDPKDHEALSALVQSLVNDQEFAQALPVCQRLNKIAPLDLLSQREELQLMSELNMPGDQIVAHARQLLEAHPGDPRFEVLMAVADGYARDDANAARLLDAAAKLPPADADSVLQIISLLDENQKFALADDLLKRAMARDSDPRLYRLSIQRLFERQQMPQVADKLKTLDPRSPDSASKLLGFHALTLYELRRSSQADPIVAALANRKDDESHAWAMALQARYAAHPAGPAEQIKTFRGAIARDPGNPIFHVMLADALAELGENENAIEAWTAAARRSPAWSIPACRISHTYLISANYKQAARWAELAIQRDPSNRECQIAYVLSQYALVARSPQLAQSGDGERLLKVLEQIQGAHPHEPVTIGPYVSLLSRRGMRDRAIEVLKSAIAAEPPLPEKTFTQLSQVSAHDGLGLERDILDRQEKAYGTTPAVAFARAIALYSAGKTSEAILLMQKLSARKPTDLAWQVADARFSDAVADPGAVRKWMAIADAHPTDLAVQYAALASPSRLHDRVFWRRLIDRVKSLSGSESGNWQIEDARWTLTGEPKAGAIESAISSLQKAVQVSPSSADAHYVLAQALLRLDKPDSLARATPELATAHDLRRDDFQITWELEQAMVAQGLRVKAVALVDSVVKSPKLPTNQRLWAASTYADLGYLDAAIKLLDSATADNSPETECQALLAQLYQRAGRPEDAASMYQKILNAPDAQPAWLEAGAEFFAVSKRPGESEPFLERLKKMPMKPGTLDVLQSHLAELRNQPREALASLVDGVKAHPQVEQLWQELSGFYLRSGQLDAGDKAAADGLNSIPDSQDLKSMRVQLARLRSLGSQELGSLVGVISHDPRQPVADEALKILADAKTRNDSPEKALSALSTLADAHAGFLPLQELVVQRCIALRRFKEAAEVALRATQVAPGNPGALRLLSAVQSATGNWPAAREAATRWREAAAASPLEPDLAIAASWLQQQNPDPDAALNQLRAYMADGSPEAQKQAALPLVCRALIMAGRGDDAAARLLPLLKQPAWRSVWMGLAAAQKDPEAATQWLGRIVPAIPSDSLPDHLALAQAWEQLGEKFDSVAAHKSAGELLRPIVSLSAPPPQVWPTWAAVNQSLGDLPEAERAWRELLKANPNEPHAQNNLAFELLLEGDAQKAGEAEKLSRAAIATDPGVSTFYDTLARILLQRGKADDAVEKFRLALDKDPHDVEAMIGLADVLQSRPNDREEAKSLLTRIDAIVQSSTPLPPLLRKQLDRVKSAISQSL